MSALTDADADGARREISLRAPRPRYGEHIIRVVLGSFALLSIGVTVGIVLSLIGPTIEFFQRVSIQEFLTTTVWAPLFADARFGVLPLVTATLLITVIAVATAVPIGLGAAIYLAEYARPRVRKVLKPVLEILAGIPTVVYGFFALEFVTPLLQQVWFFPGREPFIFNAASAALVMGIMIVPTISSLSEDALSAVPMSLRQASMGLGATRLQTTLKVTVPAALSGIVAAFVLGVSRAIGETMIVTIAAGGTPNLSLNPAEAMQTMTAFIAQAGIGDQPTGSTGYLTIFAVGSLLFVATLAVNSVSIRLVRRFREVYE